MVKFLLPHINKSSIIALLMAVFVSYWRNRNVSNSRYSVLCLQLYQVQFSLIFPAVVFNFLKKSCYLMRHELYS